MSEQLGKLAWGGFKLGFGLISFAGAWTNAVVNYGALWATDSQAEKRELAAAQERFWSLDREPLPGFRHAFFETSTGCRIHYVVREGEKEEGKEKNIAVFIHGFPDSYLIWRHLLQSPSLQQDTILVAVDLPGYGGSDSLPAYGPNEMLEALSEFLINIRQQNLPQDGTSTKRTVAVTHDWGAIIGARLASEAHVLADHWIITGGVIPSLQFSNAQHRFQLAKQMLHTWVSSPRNTRLLKNALSALKPVKEQFRRSFYIFVFHLPWPFNNAFATFGNYWFLRVLHGINKGSLQNNKVSGNSPSKSVTSSSSSSSTDPIIEAAESMAISAGPAAAQLSTKTPQDNLSYGSSVRARIPDRGMSEKTRIYRENLVYGKWEKSLETTAALYNISSSVSSSRASFSAGTLASTAPEGALKAPTTLMMGQYEPAFDQRLSLDNAREYLVRGSQVIVVKGAGHWLQIEHTGRRIMEKTLQWALRSEVGSEAIPFDTMSDVRVLESV